MGTKTYDPALQLLSVGGGIMGGFAPDSFIKVERDEEAFTKQHGAGGEVVRSKNNNKGGKVTFVLMSDSASNDFLTAIALTDEFGSLGVVPLFCKELNGTMAFAAANSWIQKLPDIERGKEAGTTTWVMDCAVLEMAPGGLL